MLVLLYKAIYKVLTYSLRMPRQTASPRAPVSYSSLDVLLQQ